MSYDINPYQSPAAQEPNLPSVQSSGSRGYFRSNTGLAMTCLVLLGLAGLIDLIAIGSFYLQVELLQRWMGGDPVDMHEANANDARQLVVGVSQLAITLLTAIFFCTWMYRVHKNLRPLGNDRLEYTAGWAAGCWFVPILNLVVLRWRF